MSDNEFDQIFSENLKNARSIIDPEEGDCLLDLDFSEWVNVALWNG